MTQQWFDALLGAMLDREPDAPDFLFVAGKQPIAQCHGALKEFEIADRKEGLSEHEIERIANAGGRLRDARVVRLQLRSSRTRPLPRKYFQATRTARHRHATIAGGHSDDRFVRPADGFSRDRFGKKRNHFRDRRDRERQDIDARRDA
jgi:hypothetical protein